MLEMDGKLGKVLMVDSSPLFLSKFMKHLLPPGSTEMNISQILRKGIAKKNKSFEKETSVLDLFSETTLDLQIKKLVESVLSNSYISTDLTKTLYDSFESRVRATANADKIQFKKLSTTSIILVKSYIKTFPDMPYDYDLKQYCSREITIHNLEGDHSTIIYNLKLGEIIENSILFDGSEKL